MVPSKKINHINGHKTGLPNTGRLKQSHTWYRSPQTKAHLHNNKNNGKIMYTCKLNNAQLNDNLDKDEIRKKIKYF